MKIEEAPNLLLAAGEATCGIIEDFVDFFKFGKEKIFTEQAPCELFTPISDEETFVETTTAFETATQEEAEQTRLKALELMQPGSCYFPYGQTKSILDYQQFNLFTALYYMPDEYKQEINDMWIEAVSETIKPEIVFKKMDQLVREYWATLAFDKAERTV